MIAAFCAGLQSFTDKGERLKVQECKSLFTLKSSREGVVWRAAQAKLGMAEGVGFEPTVELPRLWFSRPALSATQPPLRREKDSHSKRKDQAQKLQAERDRIPRQLTRSPTFVSRGAGM
jgi:hypothetical protein